MTVKLAPMVPGDFAERRDESSRQNYEQLDP